MLSGCLKQFIFANLPRRIESRCCWTNVSRLTGCGHVARFASASRADALVSLFARVIMIYILTRRKPGDHSTYVLDRGWVGDCCRVHNNRPLQVACSHPLRTGASVMRTTSMAAKVASKPSPKATCTSQWPQHEHRRPAHNSLPGILTGGCTAPAQCRAQRDAVQD